MCLGDYVEDGAQTTGGPLSQAKAALLDKLGGIDMAAYRVYAQEQQAQGVKPLPPQAWAIAHRETQE